MNEMFFLRLSELILELLKSMRSAGENITVDTFKSRLIESDKFKSLINKTFNAGCVADVVQSIIYMSEKVKHVIPSETLKRIVTSLKSCTDIKEISEIVVEFISIIVENLEKSMDSFDRIRSLILDISQKISSAAKLIDSSIKTSIDVIQEDLDSDAIIVTDLDSILTDSKDVDSFEAFKREIESKIETIFKVVKSKIACKTQYIVKLENNRVKTSAVIEDMESKDRQLSSIKTELEIYKNQSLKDFLTGLYNRKHFDKVIVQEMERFERYGSKFGIAFIDIDDFKKINDEYGHIVGDFVLKHFANIIRKNIRKTDTPFRYGGEEFLIVFAGSTSESIQTFSERIVSDIRKTVFRYRGLKISITVSIGIQEYLKGLNVEDLVDMADKKMLKAKKDGKNRLVSEL